MPSFSPFSLAVLSAAARCLLQAVDELPPPASFFTAATFVIARGDTKACALLGDNKSKCGGPAIKDGETEEWGVKEHRFEKNDSVVFVGV